jgi:hypothetical protein
VPPFGSRVANVFHCFPLASLTDDQHFDIIHFKELDLRGLAGGTRQETDFGDFELGVADNAGSFDVQARRGV